MTPMGYVVIGLAVIIAVSAVWLVVTRYREEDYLIQIAIEDQDLP